MNVEVGFALLLAGCGFGALALALRRVEAENVRLRAEVTRLTIALARERGQL